MTDETITLISTICWWVAAYAAGSAVLCAAVDWWLCRLCDFFFPPSREEICRRQAQRIVFWANAKAELHLFKSMVRRAVRRYFLRDKESREAFKASAASARAKGARLLSALFDFCNGSARISGAGPLWKANREVKRRPRVVRFWNF